jgi:hypothetical protein
MTSSLTAGDAQADIDTAVAANLSKVSDWIHKQSIPVGARKEFAHNFGSAVIGRKVHGSRSVQVPAAEKKFAEFLLSLDRFQKQLDEFMLGQYLAHDFRVDSEDDETSLSPQVLLDVVTSGRPGRTPRTDGTPTASASTRHSPSSRPGSRRCAAGTTTRPCWVSRGGDGETIRVSV